MTGRSYSRDDIETHSDGFRPSRPAVNVKVYGTIQDAWREFQRFVSVEVRREGSPVIYISARDHESEIMAAGKRADADEIDMDGPFRVRLWWD